MPLIPTLRFEILQRDDFTCQYCGRRGPETELEVDHIIARAKGGTDALENLVTICRPCNIGKGVKAALPPSKQRNLNDLVGQFFHTFDADGYIDRQGHFIADLGHGFYMVDHFEWFTGNHGFYGKRVVHISTVAKEKWSLYPDDGAMREAAQYGGKSKGGARDGYQPITDEQVAQLFGKRKNGQKA